MKGMIFAAGIGSRLKPLTDSVPKALVKIGDKTLLELVIQKFIQNGINEIIINTHHFARQIEDFLENRNYFNTRITLSHEPVLLDTGGGLKKAAHFFDDGRPFIVHNVDILSDVDLNLLIKTHTTHNPLATIAVSRRETSRYFLFDRELRLQGWRNEKNGQEIVFVEDKLNLQKLAFSGIHCISPEFFKFFPDTEKFSIIDTYLQAIKKGGAIQGWIPPNKFWIDVGKPEQLSRANELIPLPGY